MIILVAGSDSWRVGQDVARLRTHFLEKFDPSSMNLVEGNQKEHANELLGAVSAMPFLGERRMVIVHDIEPNEVQTSFIKQLVEQRADSTILLLLSKYGSKELVLLEDAVREYSGADPKTHYYDVGKQLATADIHAIAQHYGLRLTAAQMQELGQLTGDVVSRAHTLCAALKDASESGVVSEVLWRAFLPKKPESQAFDYVDALVSGNPLRSTNLCEDMIEGDGELMPVWSMIYTQLRKYYALSLAGPEFSKVAAEMGISLYEQNKIRPMLGHPAYIKKVYEAFVSLEKEGKRAKHDLARSLRELTNLTLVS